MWTGSENEINLLFPSKFQCGQTFSWWPQQAPLAPSEGRNQNFQCPLPAGAMWTLSRDSPSQPQSQKKKKQVPLLASGPGEARSATSPLNKMSLAPHWVSALPGLMKAQDSASGQNSQAFPCPYSRQRLASATPSVTVSCPLWLKPSVSPKQQ